MPEKITQEEKVEQTLEVNESNQPSATEIIKRPKITALILLVVLLLSALLLIIALRSDSSDSENGTNVGNQSVASSSNEIHNLSGIADVHEFDGYTWVALDSGIIKYAGNDTRIYDARDGLQGTAVSGLVEHDGKLWAETFDGVSVYMKDSDSFKPYFADYDDGFGGGISNVNLFLNPISNQLSVSSFDAFHIYNPSSDAFEEAIGPIDAFESEIVFTDTFGVANVWEGGTKNVLYEFPANGTEWVEQFPLTDYEEQSVYIAKAVNRVVVFGRSAGFTSCDDIGVAAATLLNEYTAGGTLTPITSLNEQFFSIGLSIHLGTEGFDAGTSTCGVNDEFIGYNFVEENGEITVVEVEGATNEWLEKPVPYSETLSTLKSLFNRDAFHKVVAVDGQGRLITLSTDGVIGEGQSNGSSSGSPGDARGIDLPFDRLNLVQNNEFGPGALVGEYTATTSTTTHPVLCNGELDYVFVVDAPSGIGGPAVQSAVVYGVNDGSLEMLADVTESLDDEEPGQVLCNDDGLYWLSLSSLFKYDKTNNTAKKVKAYDSGELHDGSFVTRDGKLLAISKYKFASSSIDQINTADGSIESITLEGVGEEGSYVFIDANESHIWVANGSNEAVAMAFDYQGKKLFEVELDATNGFSGVALADGRFLAMTFGDWGVAKDFVLLDAESQTSAKLNFQYPSDNFANNFVFNQSSGDVWVDGGSITYRVPAETINSASQ